MNAVLSALIIGASIVAAALIFSATHDRQDDPPETVKTCVSQADGKIIYAACPPPSGTIK